MADDPYEMAEDTCDYSLPDGTVCGAHVGYGIRALHLRRCDDHSDPDPDAGRPSWYVGEERKQKP